MTEQVIHLTTTGPYSVYLLTFPDGKHYVGITSQKPETRWAKGYRCNKAMSEAIEAVGGIQNIKKEILYSNVCLGYAEFQEKNCIQRYKSMWPNGYNIYGGGLSGNSRPFACKPVWQIDLKTGEAVKRWYSVRAAAEALDISSGHISEAANGKRKQAGGFVWKFADKE